MNQVNALHLRALRLAKRYRQMEASLLDVLSKMMELGAFEKLGYANAYQYCTEGLRLSESQSYALVGIARKSREVPELKTQIENGAIHLTNARRIVPLLTRENQDTWLEKAATLSQRQLEREIVREFPKQEAPERIRPLSAERSELRVGISLELEAKLAKIKDLLSRKLGKAADLEAALNAMADTYLQKNDPLAKAARQELVARPKPLYCATAEWQAMPGVTLGRKAPPHASRARRASRAFQFDHPLHWPPPRHPWAGKQAQTV